MPNIIKKSLDIGKSIIDKEWNDENKMISLINDCLGVEETINKIYSINENLKNYKQLNNSIIQ